MKFLFLYFWNGENTGSLFQWSPVVASGLLNSIKSDVTFWPDIYVWKALGSTAEGCMADDNLISKKVSGERSPRFLKIETKTTSWIVLQLTNFISHSMWQTFWFEVHIFSDLLLHMYILLAFSFPTLRKGAQILCNFQSQMTLQKSWRRHYSLKAMRGKDSGRQSHLLRPAQASVDFFRDKQLFLACKHTSKQKGKTPTKMSVPNPLSMLPTDSMPWKRPIVRFECMKLREALSLREGEVS